MRSNSGIAPTSFDPSGAATRPGVGRYSVARALTTVRHPVAESCLARRADSPSTAFIPDWTR